LSGEGTDSYALGLVPDLRWRNSIKRAAVVWLYRHGHDEVAAALLMSEIIGMSRLPAGELGIKISVRGDADVETLVPETRSWTDAEMPGALDLAFEFALPDRDWPTFAFEVAQRETATG
jgi:hypothetical protein